MTITEDLRKPFTSKPFYAVAGALDATVAQVRKVSTMERPNRDAFKITPKVVRKDISEALSTVQTEITGLPHRAQTLADDMSTRVDKTYDELVVRGRTVVDRVRNQSTSKRLTEEARTTVRRTREATSTATSSVKATGADTKRAARKTTRTAKAGAEATMQAAKDAADSALDTAHLAAEATEDAAEKLGE